MFNIMDDNTLSEMIQKIVETQIQVDEDISQIVCED